MYNRVIFILSLGLSSFLYSQNDLDAYRYSQQGIYGTARFNAMGGAFSAIGADVTNAAVNPAGLALYRKGEINYSAALRTITNNANLYNNTVNDGTARFVFNNFGFVTAWKSEKDKESRHAFGIVSVQRHNYTNTYRMGGLTNNSSIAKDMLNVAIRKGEPISLNQYYEGLGFNGLLLDTIYNKYISLVDLGRAVDQDRKITQTGRMNELNFSYAYSYKDEWYVGGSIGVPRINFSNTLTHTERDTNDSMRIGFNANGTFSTSYTSFPDEINDIYRNYLGFNALTYTEFFESTGTGYNVKLGFVYRTSDAFRFSGYYHSGTNFRMTDVFYNQLTTDWDSKKSVTIKVPENGGRYEYRIKTPSRFGFGAAYVFKKIGIFAIDYEASNYSNASLSSDDAGTFDGVNTVITNKYRLGHFLKAGAEFNVNPYFLRIGYNILSNPLTGNFTGKFTRHSPSIGVGVRFKENMSLDFYVLQMYYSDTYYLFNTLNTNTTVNTRLTQVGATFNIKFN